MLTRSATWHVIETELLRPLNDLSGDGGDGVGLPSGFKFLQIGTLSGLGYSNNNNRKIGKSMESLRRGLAKKAYPSSKSL